jgi:hypothetical protein
VQKLRNLSRFQRKKYQEEQCHFVHRAIAAKVTEAEKLFGEFRVPKAQEGQHL